MFNETGFIVAENDIILHTVFGTSVETNFPIDFIVDVHKRFPDWQIVLAHSHPRGFAQLSEEDATTLKALTLAFYPHIIYMDVICLTSDMLISHNRFWLEMETKEEWKESGRSERTMQLMCEPGAIKSWTEKILTLSYTERK